MGKTSKWIRNFLTGGKKVQTKGEYLCNEDSSVSTEIPKTPMVVHPSTPKEKKRWSFRRSASGGKGVSSIDLIAITPRSFSQGYQKDQKQPLAITDASVTDAKPQAISVRLSSASRRRPSVLQDAAATMIQSVFRSYLARKALIALKGIVKLQALMRGHLVRKQTVTTLRCMQALVNVQARTRAQRIQLAEEAQFHNRRTPYRNSPQTTRFRPTYNMDRHMESNANVRVVEMDYGESRESTRRRNSYSDSNHFERPNQRYSQQYQENLRKDYQYQMAIALSGLTNMSPDCKNFDEYSVSSEQSSPYCYSTVSKQDLTRGPCSSPQPYAESISNDPKLFPNYMANTKSFKAKARSQSAPKQRVNFLERQPSRRKGLMDGGNGFHAVRMQRCSSRVGSTAQVQELPWSLRFEKPRTSFNDSECGSDNTVLSYCRSLAANEVTTY